MTLQDLGNIGEFVGAIGVVTSFVYLAIQIRQNTRAIRLSSMQSANLSIGTSLSKISQNSENAEVFRQRLRDFDGLSEICNVAIDGPLSRMGRVINQLRRLSLLASFMGKYEPRDSQTQKCQSTRLRNLISFSCDN